ncbi:hypothetical protein [Pontimicrobium sp. MEBiC06410]
MRKIIIIIGLLLLTVSGCESNDDIVPPTQTQNETETETEEDTPINVPGVYTFAISNSAVLPYTVDLKGEIFVVATTDVNIIERGFCWSTTPNVSIDNDFIASGSGFGVFNSQLEDLIPETEYYYRAYAKTPETVVYGDEYSFITPVETKHVAFTANHIVKNIKHNIEDKILYITSIDYLDSNSNIGDATIIAYNYNTRSVIAEKAIGQFISGHTPLQSTGLYNGEFELYYVDGGELKILNRFTLNEEITFNIPNYYITSVQFRDDKLFIVAANEMDNDDMPLFVYNRNDFVQIGQGNSNFTSLHNRRHVASYDSTTDIVTCLSYPTGSNSSLLYVEKFDNSGGLLSFELKNNPSINEIVLDLGNDSNFFMFGNVVAYIDDISTPVYNFETESGYFIDSKLSADGSNIYSTKLDNGVLSVEVNTTVDFANSESHSIYEYGNNLFLDDNKVLVLNYLGTSLANTKVYLSIYEF